MKHYVIFLRSDAHCGVLFVCAPSLGEAMAVYYVQDMQDTERLEDGSIRTGDGYGGEIIYSHPLECIEAKKKVDGWDGNSWEIKELRDSDWNKPFSEAFWSADPDDIKMCIEVCRPLFRAAFPASRAKAFVWPLKGGSLVTFHRRKNPRRRWPIEIMARYLVKWGSWEQVRPWHGTYDDILEQMAE